MMILGVDMGTTGMKMGVYRSEDDTLALERHISRDYTIDTYNDGLFSDIDPEKWKAAFAGGCGEMSDVMAEVDVVALSGTTPGMTAMDSGGNALYPAILMLDQRSRAQAQTIIDIIGIDELMRVTGNMPVAGGCSLASILWIKDNHPEIFRKTHVFGHSNTYIARWLTGKFAIDPSSASLTALYNTVLNDMKWNADIAKAFEISIDRMPEIIHAYESSGRVMQSRAAELGMKKEPPVVIGGNDAVLAAYSVGVRHPGEIINVNGTCEISLVCLPKCISSRKYNVRCHVLPDRWLTLHVMNAGGIAYEWFRKLYCSEMDADTFFSEYLPEVIDTWLERESTVTYVPYLLGSRYTQKPLQAEFHGLTTSTTREELLAALVRGLCEYQREHLKLISRDVSLQKTVCVTGGAVNPSMIRAKKKWMWDGEYMFEEQSSMKGAALLGRKYLEKNR